MGVVNSKSPKGPNFADDFFGRSHRRLERPLRKQFASGIVIRGDSGTGKSSLLRRLQSASVKAASGTVSGWFKGAAELKPENELDPPYIPTRQIQVANLRWRYRETEDVIKVEVWDVVDHGLQEQISGEERRNVGVLDAETIDVYKHSNGAILMFNLCKPRTIEYVAKQLSLVPKDLPVLILGNFADKLYAQEDEAFLFKRFAAIRGETALSAPLHFMCGSLTQPACPSNPPSGMLPAILKFFEIPFLQLQQTVLMTRLKINEEQIGRAKMEWDELTSPTSPAAPSILTIPEAARTSTNLGSLDSVSTDTLTMASRIAWNDQGVMPNPANPVNPANLNNKTYW